MKEFAEAVEDIKEENERQKRNIEAAKLQSCKAKKGGTIKQWQETGRLKQ